MVQTFTHNLLHPRYWLTWSGLGLLWLLVQLPYPVLLWSWKNIQTLSETSGKHCY